MTVGAGLPWSAAWHRGSALTPGDNPCQDPWHAGNQLVCQKRDSNGVRTVKFPGTGQATIPCQGKRHLRQVLGTKLAPVPGGWHRDHSGQWRKTPISPVIRPKGMSSKPRRRIVRPRERVLGANLTGPPTLKSVPETWHRSTAQVTTSAARDSDVRPGPVTCKLAN